MFHGRHQTTTQDSPLKNQDPYTQYLLIVPTTFDNINKINNTRGGGNNSNKCCYDDNAAALLGMLPFLHYSFDAVLI